MFQFVKFGKLKYVYHNIDTYLGFQWANDLSPSKAISVVIHLLEFMAIVVIPVQIETDNVTAYVSSKMILFKKHYNKDY